MREGRAGRRSVAVSMAMALGALGVTFAVAFAEAPGASAATPPISTQAAPLPSDADTGTVSTSLNDVSCGAAGFCVTGGQYFDNKSHHSPLIDTYSGGAWHARRAPVPAGTVTYPDAAVTHVSCSGSGLCAALGTYDSTHQFIDTLYGGHWYTTVAPAPADANPDDYVSATSIACLAPASCYAVGDYNIGLSFVDSMSIVGGVPTWTSVRAPTPDFPPIYVPNGNGSPSYFEQMGQVSCGATVGCWAAGSYITFQDPTNKTGAWEDQGLFETLSGTTATPGWAAPIPGAENDAWSADMYTIGCGHGACLATGYYTTNSPTFGSYGRFVDTNNGSGFAPTKAAWPSDVGASHFGDLRAASCGSNSSCVVVGSYINSGSVGVPMIVDAGTAFEPPAPTGGWGSSEQLGAVSCASTTTCLAASVGNPNTPSDTLVIKFGSSWISAHAPALPSQGTYVSEYVATACDTDQHCFAVAQYGGAIVTVGTTSASAPKVTLTKPSAPFTLGSSTTVAWTGSGTGASIKHYKVEERHAAWNSDFSTWTTPSAWANLPATTTHVSAALGVGDTTCFRVQATDSLGHTAWSKTGCTAMPLDDTSLAASSGWSRVSKSGYYRGSYSSNTHLHATLTRTGAEFDRIALVATKCPTCGKVGIYSGSTHLATVDLHASGTTHQVIVVLAKVSQRTATVTIKVLTSGRTIQIDGLGVTRN